MADRTILERKSAENGAEKRTANRPFSSDTYESNRCQVDQPTHQASKKGRNEKALAECRVPFQAHNEESHTALLQRHAGRVDAQSHESLETANQHISAPAAVAREANSGRKNDNASTAAQSALRQHQAYGFSLYGSVPGMIPGMHYQTSLRPSIMPHPSMPIPSGQSVVKEKALRPMQKSAQHSAMSIGTAVAEAAKIATTRERTSTVAQPVVREQSLNSLKGTNGQSTMSSGKAPTEARNIRANSEKTSVLYTAAQSALRQHQAYGSSLYGSVPGMIPSMQYQIPLRPSIMPHPSMPIPSPYLGVPYHTSPTSPYVMQYPPGISTLWPYGPSLYPTPGFANRLMHHSSAAQVPTMDQGLDLTKPPKDQAYLSEKQRLELTKLPKDQAYLSEKQRLDLTKLPNDQACLNDKQSKILRIHFTDNYFPSDEEFYAMSVQIGHPVQLIKMWFDWERSRNITSVSKNLPLASSINVKEYIRSGKLEPASDDAVDTRSRVERAQKHRATESAVNAQIGPHAAKKPRTLTGDPGSAPEATSTNKETTNQIQTQQNPAAPEYFHSKGEIEGTIRTAPFGEWEMPCKKIDTSVRYMPQDYFTNGSNIYSSENRWNKRRKEILNDPNFDTNKYSIAEDTVHNLAGILDIPENVVKDWCKRLKDSQAVKEPYALDALRPSLRWLYVPGPIKMSDTRKFYFCEYCSLGGARRYKLRYFIIHQYHFFQTNKCEEEAGLLYQWFDGRFNPRYGSGATPALNVQLKPESNSNPERRTSYNMQHIPEAAQLLDNPLKAKSRDLVVNNVSKNPELLKNPLKTTSQDLVVNNVSKNPELLENPLKTTPQDLVVNNISKNPEQLENPLKTTSQDLVVNNISKNPELLENPLKTTSQDLVVNNISKNPEQLENPLKTTSQDLVVNNISKNPEPLENPLTTKPKDPVVSSTLESYITPIPVGTVTFRSDETIVDPTIIKPITPKTESVPSKLEPISPKPEPIPSKLEPIST